MKIQTPSVSANTKKEPPHRAPLKYHYQSAKYKSNRTNGEETRLWRCWKRSNAEHRLYLRHSRASRGGNQTNSALK